MKKWNEMTRGEILARGLVKAACEGHCTDCPLNDWDDRCDVLATQDPQKVLNLFGRTNWAEDTPGDDLPEEPKQTPNIRLTREDCLKAARIKVTGKESDYGTPEDNFQTIADMWSVYLLGEHFGKFAQITPTDVAAMMALLKIARIGGRNATADSFVDLAGYAACGCEIATGGKE